MEQLSGEATKYVDDSDALFDTIPKLVKEMEKSLSSAAAPARRGAIPDDFVFVEGGTFTMGSSEEEQLWASREAGTKNGENLYRDESPQHQVTVNSFYMGKYEVTQKEWVEVMGTNPSGFK